MRLCIRLLCAARGRQFFVTTPIFYVNSAPHLGHAYTAVMADAVARAERLLYPNASVTLTSGTDEHGIKVQRAAAAAGVSPQQHTDCVSRQYQDMLRAMEVQTTDFVRTTQDRHKTAVQHFWRELEGRGHIYKTRYSGWYSVNDETFVPESQIDEIVKDGRTIKVSSESGQSVEWTEEDNYMFRLSDFRSHLLQWLSTDGVVKPSKYQQQLREMLSDSYLPDISVSRPASRVQWAIPVPTDATQSVYVWLDALVNYLTVTGYPHSEHMERRGWLWPPDVHVIGKDILKFHGIYWPAFLMAAGMSPPRAILCHGHWTVDGRKMSKSLGNVVTVQSAPAPPPALRYLLLREAPPHSDANYSETKLIRAVNSELADSVGNLLSRCTRPALNPRSECPGLAAPRLAHFPAARHLVSLLNQLPEVCRVHYEEHHFYRVADACIAAVHAANAMLEAEKPWHLIKRQDPEAADRLSGVLHVALETLRVVGILLSPIAPSITDALLDKLAVPVEERTWANAGRLSWEAGVEAVPARALPPHNLVLLPRIVSHIKQESVAR